ncbi:MAG: hypothetical protein FJ146_16895 [Deltaproteobacteria bacterium]|nr:hypothetical protein [Deltaproteobacteria bacterium]
MMRLNSALLVTALLGLPACGRSDGISVVRELTDADIAPYMTKLDELSAASGKTFRKASNWPWGRTLTVIGFLHREIVGNDRRLAVLKSRPEATVLLTSTAPEDHEAGAINVICDGNYPKFFVWSLDK